MKIMLSLPLDNCPARGLAITSRPRWTPARNGYPIDTMRMLEVEILSAAEETALASFLVGLRPSVQS